MATKVEELKNTTTVAEKNGTRGISLLNDHFRNHDTAFTSEERKRYGLEGLLPHAHESLQRQTERVLQHLDAKTSDMEQYVYLTSLADRNETLFFHTVMSGSRPGSSRFCMTRPWQMLARHSDTSIAGRAECTLHAK